ncbi:hypothetical protein GQ53DRAFT_849077 [Thozetella sp. PMI_491]|nr:hypothetical protein GQ53DRAFT_849077 [Thozetella sp. PMI_491]
MRFSPIHFFVGLCIALVRANPPVAVPKGVVGAREALNLDKIVERGLSGSSCDYGDPLAGTSTYSYTELCTTPSNCEENLGGYVVSNYCSGGSNNKCCIRSKCKSPYTADGCADTRYYVCNGGSFISGYCPGPSTYQCCA